MSAALERRGARLAGGAGWISLVAVLALVTACKEERPAVVAAAPSPPAKVVRAARLDAASSPPAKAAALIEDDAALEARLAAAPVDRTLLETRDAALRLLSLVPEAPLSRGSWRRESQLLEDECSLPKRRARSRRSRQAEHTLFAAPSMPQCRGLASAEAVCQCLAQLSPAGATCELAELRTSHARLAYVRHREDSEDVVAGSLLYLIASTGAAGAPAWSALALADSSQSVDLDETPRMSSSVELVHFEELPLAAGTLFWVQSQNDVTDHCAGDYEERGEASLLLCTIPARATGAGTCYPPLRLAEWSQSTREFADEDEGDDERDDAGTCTDASVTAYRFELEASGRGALTLVRGKDAERRAGTYQLR